MDIWFIIEGSKMKQTQFRVIGAGPFAIATAAYAKHLGLDVSVFGRTVFLDH